MVSSIDTKSVKQIFSEYLEIHGLKKTPERFAILETTYSMSGHFDIDTLMCSMLDKQKFRVSRATFYNTIRLLVEAKLVLHHQFGKISQYEKSYNVTPHYHLICTNCGKIMEIQGNIIQKELESLHTKSFAVSHYSLFVYGVCNKCSVTKKTKTK